MKEYDFLIVGAGLFGAVFAFEITKLGYKCLVIDKRNHKGGNLYCEEISGINIHRYGPHIFHTNDKSLWDCVNQFVTFNNFRYAPIAKYQDKLYNLPFNMNTFYQLWGVQTPEEAIKKLHEGIFWNNNCVPRNLEEQALRMCGKDIYEKLIKGYTQKQWGRNPEDLPPSIIRRIPVRFTYDNNYFDDKFQGIPNGGYNKIIEGLLKNIEVRLNIDYLADRTELNNLATKIVFTGSIDQFYDQRFGTLEYRSLKFTDKILDIDNFQGCAVINYTEKQIPYTRVIEHKHFEFGKQNKTIITFEHPIEFNSGLTDPYYPINDERNNRLYKKYKSLSQQSTQILFGGRLGEYKYYDMHQIIASALKLASTFPPI